jgi:hypothetical protein
MSEVLMFRLPAATFAALLLLGSGSASAVTIDFEDFEHGEVVASDQDGYTLSVDNFNKKKPDVAIAFTATSTGRNSLSKQPGLAGYGNVLVLQDEHCKKGSCTDEWHSPGHSSGTLGFTLDETANSVSFDLLGLSRGSLKKSTVTFFNDATELETIKLKSLIDKKVQIQHLDLVTAGLFDGFEISLKGSGIDNIVVGNSTPVPEPGTAALLGMGLCSVAYAVRRRH